MMGRLFMSDEGFFVDRKKPTGEVREDGAELFEECDPEDMVDELEARVEELKLTLKAIEEVIR